MLLVLLFFFLLLLLTIFMQNTVFKRAPIGPNNSLPNAHSQPYTRYRGRWQLSPLLSSAPSCALFSQVRPHQVAWQSSLAMASLLTDWPLLYPRGGRLHNWLPPGCSTAPCIHHSYESHPKNINLTENGHHFPVVLKKSTHPTSPRLLCTLHCLQYTIK